MPQLAPIVFTDDQGDSHTFTPNGMSNGVATLVQSTGVPIGNKRLTVASTQTQTGKLKTSIKLAVPVVQDVVSAGISKPTVVRTAYVDIVFTFDNTSSDMERGHLWSMVKALFSNSPLLTDVVVTPSQLY